MFLFMFLLLLLQLLHMSICTRCPWKKYRIEPHLMSRKFFMCLAKFVRKSLVLYLPLFCHVDCHFYHCKESQLFLSYFCWSKNKHKNFLFRAINWIQCSLELSLLFSHFFNLYIYIIIHKNRNSPILAWSFFASDI